MKFNITEKSVYIGLIILSLFALGASYGLNPLISSFDYCIAIFGGFICLTLGMDIRLIIDNTYPKSLVKFSANKMMRNTSILACLLSFAFIFISSYSEHWSGTLLFTGCCLNNILQIFLYSSGLILSNREFTAKS